MGGRFRVEAKRGLGIHFLVYGAFITRIGFWAVL